MVLLSVATALVVGAAASPASRVGVALGVPAAALDRRPVLRHLPVALPDHRADHPGRRPGDPGSAARCRSRRAFAVAALSWRFIEEPVRHGAIGRGLAQRGRGRVPAGSGPAADPDRPGGLRRRVRPGHRGPDRHRAAGLGGAGRGHPAACRGEHTVARPRHRPRPPRRRAPSPSPPKRAPARSKSRGHQAARAPRPLRARPLVLPVGRAHRRLHLGRPDLARLPAQPEAADQRAVRQGGRRPRSSRRSPAPGRSWRPTRTSPTPTPSRSS